MEKFEVNILGCGSASPTLQHNPTSQVINFREKLFMVDCGEGAQKEFRRQRLKMSRLSSIFISHLHGDHCFGLLGLISTLGLLGHTSNLDIYAHKDLKELMLPLLNYFCKDNPFKIEIHSFSTEVSDIIYEDKSMLVRSIPLIHRVPCAGFLFEEKPRQAHLQADMIKYHNVPVKQLNDIKNGADFIKEDGTIVPNSHLTRPALPTRRYAYCSDTAYNESIVPIIEGADLLYHESTFMTADAARAKQTAHSTAVQAAQIAKMAGVKKLMLGHFSSRYPDNSLLLEEARPIFENVILANEGICEKL